MGSWANQNGEEEPVQTLYLHLNHNNEEELVQPPVNETSIPRIATSLKEGSIMNLHDVSAVIASKITGRDLSSAPLLGTNSTSVGTDNQFGDYIRLSDNVSDAIKSKTWPNGFINLADLLPSKNNLSMLCPVMSLIQKGILELFGLSRGKMQS